MIGLVLADAAFALGVFVETLAILSALKLALHYPLREELDPILAFYGAHIAPVIGVLLGLVPGSLPSWFRDAYVVAFVLAFLFFIAQARAAMAPYPDHGGSSLEDYRRSWSETLVDAALPAAFCVLGAGLLSLTLLPLLTPPVTLWLLARRISGRPSWFAVSRSYYANLVVVAALTAAIASLPR